MLPDGTLVSGGVSLEFGTMIFWNLNNGQAIYSFRFALSDEVRSIVVLKNGNLACALRGRNVIYDTKNRKIINTLYWHFFSFVNSLVLFPDGRLASAANDNKIRISSNY